MFLTTEPSIPNSTHTSLRIIFGSGESSTLNIAIGMALAALEREAMQLGADGVIGAHLSISEKGGMHNAAIMGTAIKFQES